MSSSSDFNKNFSPFFNYENYLEDDLNNLPCLSQDDFFITIAALEALSYNGEIPERLSAELANSPKLAKKINILKEDYQERELSAPGYKDKLRDLFNEKVLEKKAEFEKMPDSEKEAYIRTYASPNKSKDTPFDKSRYHSLFYDQFKNLPLLDASDFPIIAKALRSIAKEEPFSEELKEELLKRPELAERIIALKKDYQRPHQWALPNHEKDFLELFNKTLIEKAEQLEGMSSRDKEFHIENYHQDKQKALEYQANIKRKRAPEIGSEKRVKPRHKSTDTIEDVRDFIARGYSDIELSDYIMSCNDPNLLQDIHDEFRSKLPLNVKKDLFFKINQSVLEELTLLIDADQEEIQQFIQTHRISFFMVTIEYLISAISDKKKGITNSFTNLLKEKPNISEKATLIFETFIATSPPLECVEYITDRLLMNLSEEGKKAIHNYLLNQKLTIEQLKKFIQFYMSNNFSLTMGNELSKVILDNSSPRYQQSDTIENVQKFLMSSCSDRERIDYILSCDDPNLLQDIFDKLRENLKPAVREILAHKRTLFLREALSFLLNANSQEIELFIQRHRPSFFKDVMEKLSTTISKQNDYYFSNLIKNESNISEKAGQLFVTFVSTSPPLKEAIHLARILPMNLSETNKKNIHNYIINQELTKHDLNACIEFYGHYDFSQNLLDELLKKAHEPGP